MTQANHPEEENDGSGDIATGDGSSHGAITWILIGIAAVLVIGGQLYGFDNKWFTSLIAWFKGIL